MWVITHVQIDTRGVLTAVKKTVKCREAWSYDIESTWRGMKEGLVEFKEYWNVGKLIKKILLVLRNYMG